MAFPGQDTWDWTCLGRRRWGHTRLHCTPSTVFAHTARRSPFSRACSDVTQQGTVNSDQSQASADTFCTHSYSAFNCLTLHGPEELFGPFGCCPSAVEHLVDAASPPPLRYAPSVLASTHTSDRSRSRSSKLCIPGTSL